MTDDEPTLVYEKWLPPGMYRMDREKYDVDTTRLAWVMSDGTYRVLMRSHPEIKGILWTVSVHQAMHSDEYDDDRGPYYQTGPAIINEDIRLPHKTRLEDVDPRTIGLRAYLVMQPMLPRFRQMERVEKIHTPSRMPRRR